MKTKTIITELNQEDLVVLLSTSTYGSSWLDCVADDREGLDIKDGDCYEDVLAKALLAGRKIKCQDYYAEEETYGSLESHLDEDGNAEYLVGLDDIKEGLQKCADGTFKHDGDGEVGWLKECFDHLVAGGYDLDLPEAEALMQVVIFGELIYG